jgi:hypothetical protein
MDVLIFLFFFAFSQKRYFEVLTYPLKMEPIMCPKRQNLTEVMHILSEKGNIIKCIILHTILYL